MTWLLLSFLVGISASASADDQLPRLSVCDLVGKRLEYNGRLIAVRGTVAAGGHGPYLIAPKTCPYELVTRGIVWPNIINLVFPDNRSPDVNAHAEFALDWKAVQATDEYLLRSHFRAGVDTEVATYVGLFITYPDLDKRVSPEVPGALRLGFGPAGMGAPAQLVIKTVEDVSVTRGGMPRSKQ